MLVCGESVSSCRFTSLKVRVHLLGAENVTDDSQYDFLLLQIPFILNLRRWIIIDADHLYGPFFIDFGHLEHQDGFHT